MCSAPPGFIRGGLFDVHHFLHAALHRCLGYGGDDVYFTNVDVAGKGFTRLRRCKGNPVAPRLFFPRSSVRGEDISKHLRAEDFVGAVQKAVGYNFSQAIVFEVGESAKTTKNCLSGIDCENIAKDGGKLRKKGEDI